MKIKGIGLKWLVMLQFVSESIFLVLLIMTVTASSSHSASMGWKPEKNVEIVTGSTPGGGLDRTARLIQKVWQEKRMVDAAVTVVSKPGGGNAVSWAYLNRHVGDGHYLSITSLSLLTNHITGSNPLKHTDVTPIAQLFSEYLAFAVNGDSPIKTGKDLVDRLKKDPKSLSIAITPSVGGSNHIAVGLVMKSAGVDIKKLKTVVFNSGGEGTIALLGGHVDLFAVSAANFLEQVKAGKVRIVAICSPQRLGGALADIPTWKEQGINVVFGTWRGVIGPKGMNEAQIAYWEEKFTKLVQTVEWKKELENNLFVDTFMKSNESKKYLEAQYNELKDVLIALGVAK